MWMCFTDARKAWFAAAQPLVLMLFTAEAKEKVFVFCLKLCDEQHFTGVDESEVYFTVVHIFYIAGLNPLC